MARRLAPHQRRRPNLANAWIWAAFAVGWWPGREGLPWATREEYLSAYGLVRAEFLAECEADEVRRPFAERVLSGEVSGLG